MPDTDIDWDDTISSLQSNKLTPVISNQLVNQMLFGSGHVASWADGIHYPLPDTDNLSRVAQFLSVTDDPDRTKRNYLRFLKENLLDLARAEPNANREYLERVKRGMTRLTFSELATEWLRYPDFEKEKDHPLRILADMDIDIYLTTSHHAFMEAALRATGKKPRSEVYCWCDHVQYVVHEECRPNPDFEPAVETPLVYHLHGLDSFAESIVLTEDDHLRFLASIVQNLGDARFIPHKVRTAIANSLLVLLGYELHAWDLRVLWHGLLNAGKRHTRGFSIQLDPDKTEGIRDCEAFQSYLQEYFDRAKIDVYWGTPQDFMTTLRDKWRGG
jgi:hypothetical protein